MYKFKIRMNQKLGRNFDSQLIYSSAKSKAAENWVVSENWRFHLTK